MDTHEEIDKETQIKLLKDLNETSNNMINSLYKNLDYYKELNEKLLKENNCLREELLRKSAGNVRNQIKQILNGKQ